MTEFSINLAKMGFLTVFLLALDFVVEMILIRNIEDNLSVTNELARDTDPFINLDGDVWRKPVIDTPFMNGADKIGLGRSELLHGYPRKQGAGKPAPFHDYLRMAFSFGVSESMNAWRVKRRSAYFRIGAMALVTSMP